MSFHLLKLTAWPLLVSCLLLNYYVTLVEVSCAWIPLLPDNLRAQTRLVYLDGAQQSLFKIDEFVARPDGSIRLNVADHSNGSGPQQRVETSYFRLFQGANRRNENDKFDISMVASDSQTGECRSEHTTSWALRDFSFLLSKIALFVDPSDGRANLDSVAIGPTALLEQIYQNPALFRLEAQAYEDILMANTSYFSATLANFSVSLDAALSAKLIVAIPTDRVAFPDDVGKPAKKSPLGTPLSEANLSEHPAMVALIWPSNTANGSKLTSPELLNSLKNSNSSTSDSPRSGLILSYDLIQERSLSRLAALEHLNDELANPFQLPVSCGSLTLQRPLYVNARQFSGQFEALGFEQKFAVAYDRSTNHLRYDSLHEFKMIYALSEQLATFISISDERLALSSKTSNESQESGYYHQAHQNKERCAQTDIINERGSTYASRSWLFDRNSLADILGLGPQIGLMYLGQKRLANEEDGELMACRVYEREVSAAQIPALLGLHTHTDLAMRERRFYLNFYFIDETDSESEIEPEIWQSMWLKRVELISIDPEARYRSVAACLTFSSFSWSLDSIGTSDTLTSRQTELSHPARTFDTLECWSERGQLEVNFLLKKVDEPEWDQAPKAGSRLRSSMQMLSSFEETILVFLERTLILARSEINELDIVAPSMKSIPEVEARANNSLESPSNLWVSFKVTKPFNYLYKRTQLGWIESFLELLHANQARLIKYKMGMAVHECSSRLVTQLGQPHSIHMLHCPNIGCGYLVVDKLEDIKYEQVQGDKNSDKLMRDKNPFVESFQMCEIHKLAKTISMRAIESDIYKPEVIKRYLSRSSLMIFASDANNEAAKQPYRAHVTKLSLLDGGSRHDRWDQEVIYSVCYSVNMTLEFKGKPYKDKRSGLRVLQLDLDRHHSRAHCRRACLLYQFCQTYSYNRASRQCTLTNIHRRFLFESNFNLNAGTLDSSLDCSIYALDHAVMYQRSRRLEMKMPAELVEDKNVLLLNTSLSNCASLCHMDEFAFEQKNSTAGNTLIDCQSFYYLSLWSLCALKNTGQKFDYKVGLVKKEEHFTGAEELETRIGGKQQMYEASAYESYTRNYASYFASRYGIKIHLIGPSHEDGWVDDEQPEKVLKGLSLNGCQRECAMLDEDCAALDYCLVNEKGIQVDVCHLYSVRSPLTFATFQLDRQPHPAGDVFKKLQLEPGNSLLRELTHSEKLFYLDGQSNNHELVIHSRNCHHFYLDGNNLYLKRLLAKSARNYMEEKESIEQLVERDKATSRQEDASLERAKNLYLTMSGLNNSEAGLHILMKIWVGLFIGMLVFLVQPKVVELGTKVDLVKSFHPVRWLHSLRTPITRTRTDRTMSMVDIVELADVDSP